MQRLAALFCCLVTLAVGCEAFTWKPCDADKVPFIPDTVQLIPDPPVIGNTVTFNIKGNAGELRPIDGVLVPHSQ